MFFTEEKLRARVQNLMQFRYRDRQPIDTWSFEIDEKGLVGTRPHPLTAEPPSADHRSPNTPIGRGSDTLHIGDTWKGRDLYAWLATKVSIPSEWSDKRVLGRFDFGRTGGGNNSGFESLLYLDGQPFQGVDSNHQEVFLPHDRIGQDVSLQFRLWSGLEGGGRPREQEYKLQTAEICWLDNDTDDLFYTAMAILQTIHYLDANNPDRVDLLSGLDAAFYEIDWATPGSDGFYKSVAAARQRVNHFLDMAEKHHPVTIHCVGHTHIDVAWLWRLKHTREKSARSFSTVLRLMELYPEYIFLQTQPQLYDYIKSDYPDIFARIKERVEEGRWEAGGAMWLEADCNLSSGESLVRQILYGTRFFEREFGTSCTYLWLPDVFGYSWALPQILKKSNIHTFMTTKISWNQYNRMPHDTFTWRGIDGSEVLAHFITTPEPEAHGWFYTYNGQLTASTVAGSWNAYRDKNLNKDLLVSYGFGDGGGGVTRDMLEMRRRLNRIPGLPQVETGRADEYFERLNHSINKTDQYVHTWDGELYLEYHRGTYTSQAYNKRMNRKLELKYRETEWLSILATTTNAVNHTTVTNSTVNIPMTHNTLILQNVSTQERQWQKRLHEGWKIILRNQFHDIIPGSSIHEVYEDSKEEYAEAWQIADGVWQEGVATLLLPSDPVSSENPGNTHPATALTVLNSSTFERSAIVQIPESLGFSFEDSLPFQTEFVSDNGERLPTQKIGDAWYVLATKTPSMGYQTIIAYTPPVTALELMPSEQTSPFCVSESSLSTPFYILEWNEHGQLTRIFDRSANREVIAKGARANILQVFEDKPLAHDAWDIDLFYQEKMREVGDLQSIETISVGPVCATLRFIWSYMHSTISQDMVLYTHSHRIDFVTSVDWHEHQQLLKVAFPVQIRSTEATFDIQFGNVKRPTHWNTSWDQARFETVGHQWADLSESGYGVSLLNDCKYGYDVKDNVLRLSLIKSAIHPDYMADQGKHEFTYALLPHSGDWREGNTVPEAWDLNSPLQVAIGAMQKSSLSLFSVSCENVLIDAVKQHEDSEQVVIRLHEFAGGRHEVEIISDLAIASWQCCNLLEQPDGDKSTAPFIFTIHPYEIKTFLIEFGR